MARRLSAAAHVSRLSSHSAVVDAQQLELFMLLARCVVVLLELATPQLQPPSIARCRRGACGQRPCGHLNCSERLERGSIPRLADAYGRWPSAELVELLACWLMVWFCGS